MSPTSRDIMYHRIGTLIYNIKDELGWEAGSDLCSLTCVPLPVKEIRIFCIVCKDFIER